jgi:NADH-quinone oxidoreductase subunit J
MISMMIPEIVFYVFAAGIVGAGVGVISARNPVHSALSLVAAFVFSAVLWILLQAEFLGLILVLVYVGAVMTLLLFVVMMLRLDVSLKKGFIKHVLFALVCALIILGLMVSVLGPNHFGSQLFPEPAAWPANYSNMQALGAVLYTQYVYPFELAAVILLVALIAAIALTYRGPRSRKKQLPEEQVLVKKSDRLRIVSVPPLKKDGE